MEAHRVHGPPAPGRRRRLRRAQGLHRAGRPSAAARPGRALRRALHGGGRGAPSHGDRRPVDSQAGSRGDVVRGMGGVRRGRLLRLQPGPLHGGRAPGRLPWRQALPRRVVLRAQVRGALGRGLQVRPGRRRRLRERPSRPRARGVGRRGGDALALPGTARRGRRRRRRRRRRPGCHRLRPLQGAAAGDGRLPSRPLDGLGAAAHHLGAREGRPLRLGRARVRGGQRPCAPRLQAPALRHRGAGPDHHARRGGGRTPRQDRVHGQRAVVGDAGPLGRRSRSSSANRA